jgi:hypothetical protein
MKTALPKPPGRPGTGRDPTVQLRMPLGLINDIESWAAKFEKLDRSAAMRALVALGLRAGRRQNCILDPKGYKRHDRGDNVALAASRLIDHDHLAAIRGHSGDAARAAGKAAGQHQDNKTH